MTSRLQEKDTGAARLPMETALSLAPVHNQDLHPGAQHPSSALLIP